MISSIRRWFSTHDGLNAAIALFTLLLLGALWGAVVTEKRAERDAVIAAAINQNTNLTVAYEEHIVRTLKLLDGALLFMRHEHQRLGAGLDINRYIEKGDIDGTLFSILSVIDENGNVIRSSKPIDSVNYADRDFFRTHQLRYQQDTFFIDKPLLGRVSNTWQVPMSRGIIKPDGSFGGVIVLSVDPSSLALFYQKVDIGQHGVVMLIGTDGVIRARRVGNELEFGTDVSATTLMREQAKKATGEILGGGGVDGIRRYVSYRTLPAYPLVVAVGAGQQEVLAAFNRYRNRDYMLVALVSLVIVVFAGMLMATLTRQKRTVVDLQASEARFRAAFEQAAIGIAHTSLERRYLQVNQKYCDMLGYSLEELMSMSADDITYLDDRENSSIHRQQLLSGIAGSISAEKRYVRKDGNLIWVNRTISLVRDHAGSPLYFLHLVEDIMERKRLEEELRELALTDMLTGLPNRRAFITRLEEEHARLRRFDAQQAAVLMLDLDYFKNINDTWGHPAGDAVLRKVATEINEQIREVDLCGRIGGEEFAVLLTGATPAAAREFAERLRRRIADIAVMHEGKNIKVTASIGVAALRATDTDAAAALMRADRALYTAKEAGRDQVEVIVTGD